MNEGKDIRGVGSKAQYPCIAGKRAFFVLVHVFLGYVQKDMKKRSAYSCIYQVFALKLGAKTAEIIKTIEILDYQI